MGPSFLRISLGLCNTFATFQKCMVAIFFDLVEHFLKVFIDDLSVFGDSFDLCLRNLSFVLKKCEETNFGVELGKVPL